MPAGARSVTDRSAASIAPPIRAFASSGACAVTTAVTVGIIGILSGHSTSIEWLEMPKAVWPVLLVCFLVFAWPMVSMFARSRNPEGFQISAWYMAGADAEWQPLGSAALDAREALVGLAVSDQAIADRFVDAAFEDVMRKEIQGSLITLQ